jgi:hypothetical protein
LWRWCIKVSLFFLDKNYNFASHVTFAGKKKKVANFEKSYQLWKTHPNLPSFENVLWPKKGSVICYTNITQLYRAAPVVSYKSCNVCWLKKNKLPTLKEIINFEKHTQSYQVLKTYFDKKKALLFYFVTQKYSRLKSAII